jgi:uncharacterized membrane protein
MATDENRDETGGNANGDLQETLRSALKSKELLVPAALSAVGAVAATKGPSLLKRLTESTEQKGEQEVKELGEKAAEGAKKELGGVGGGLAGKALSKALGGSKGGGGGGAKKTRRLPIQRWTDVAVPVNKAYEAWLNFEDYPQFMHRVLNVEQKGKDEVSWQEKIWFSTRQWEGKITDRRANDRIAWKTTNGMSHSGVVTFHKLSDNLTRVMVTMEFEPTGMIEKLASGLRFVKRAVQADLARYKAFVEMDDAKGIEYRPVHDDEEEQSSSEKEKQGDRNRRNGDAERRERESRRQERREATSS